MSAGKKTELSQVMRELNDVLDDLDALLKSNELGAELAGSGINISLALTAAAGLRAYLRGDKVAALDDLGTAVEEIAARASVDELQAEQGEGRGQSPAGLGRRLAGLGMHPGDG